MAKRVIPIDFLKYNTELLYKYFKNNKDNILPIETQNAPHIKEWKRNNIHFNGKTIQDVKSFLNKTKGNEYNKRNDWVLKVNESDPCVLYNMSCRPIINQLKELNLKLGTITFFLQHKYEDVPLHVDYPYRKNSLLMIPIFFNEYEPTNAITYYENKEEYNILSPVIMDVMTPHGVKNIHNERLMLHIELPYNDIESIIKILDDRANIIRNT